MDISQLIVSVLAMAIGGAILVYAGISISRGSQRKSWSHTIGEVTTSEIEKNISSEDGGTDYFPIVRYRYKVNLVEYESDFISRSEASFAIGNYKVAKAKIDRYKLNSKVKVYYNPDNPQEAALEIKTSTSGMILLIILGISTLLCGLLLLFGTLVGAGVLADPIASRISLFV